MQGITYLSHADSALVDAIPSMTVQHLLSQQIFIGETEIPPLCPDNKMIQDIDTE
jgi:hypothetical protein